MTPAQIADRLGELAAEVVEAGKASNRADVNRQLGEVSTSLHLIAGHARALGADDPEPGIRFIYPAVIAGALTARPVPHRELSVLRHIVDLVESDWVDTGLDRAAVGRICRWLQDRYALPKAVTE